MNNTHSSLMYRVLIGWMAVICIWSIFTTTNLYERDYGKLKDGIYWVHDYDSLSHLSEGGPKLKNIDNWESSKTTLSDPAIYEKMANDLIANEKRKSTTSKQLSESNLSLSSFGHVDGIALAKQILDPVWRQTQIDEADKHIAIIENALSEASLSSFLGLYVYWLIIPIIFGVAPAVLFKISKSRRAEQYIFKQEALRIYPSSANSSPPINDPSENTTPAAPKSTFVEIKPLRLPANESPRSILRADFKSIPELPIKGGWGYTMEDAVIIDKDDPIVSKDIPFNGTTIEHIFIQKRIYEELICFRPEHDRYSGIEWNPVRQTLKEIDGRYYDVLTFDVTALPDKDYDELKAEWTTGHGTAGFNKEEHLRKRESRLIHYVAEYWFDITSFYGSN